MRTSKIILLSLAIISLLMIIGHLLNMPSYSVVGWFKSHRVSKIAHIEISGQPIAFDSWAARFGDNRPQGDRPHEIISELEIRMQHQTRSGLVEMTVTGDSEADVDAFIETIRRDVNHTYSDVDKETGIAIPNGYVHSVYEVSRSEYYWRQKYLGLLVFNVVALTLAFIMLVRHSKNRAQQVAASDR